MLNFKPDSGGDLAESSDDLEGPNGVGMDDDDHSTIRAGNLHQQTK